MRPTFLAKVAFPGSRASMFHMLLRPDPCYSNNFVHIGRLRNIIGSNRKGVAVWRVILEADLYNHGKLVHIILRRT